MSDERLSRPGRGRSGSVRSSGGKACRDPCQPARRRGGSGGEAVEAGDGLVEDFGAFAEGEADDRTAGVRVVVEDLGGYGDHAAAFGQGAAELDAVGTAEG